ncbi:MAG: hypothetical protein IK088_08380 [Lachnospiraceae bacterium]|nr:hypothetical protein [Lachnospiraceae bacterium]
MLQVGFSRVVINPELGADLEGYFIERKTEGYLDNIEANGLALKSENECLVILTLDLCQIWQKFNDIIRREVSEATGVPFDRLFTNCTHTHTSPIISNADTVSEDVQKYFPYLIEKLVEATNKALEDLKPARVGWKIGTVPNISHCRRWLMKDGSIKTNPGNGNPDVLREMSPVDERVNVLRFDQEGGYSIIVANYGNHPDAIGGSKISADYPGFFRRAFEAAVPNTRCIYWNGAEGDIGFNNVFAKDGDLNDTFKDFDDVLRGYDHSRFVGESITGAVLQVFRKVNYFEPQLKVKEMMADLPANVPTKEEAIEAHRIHELHIAGKDSEIPYSGMMLTTVVAEAERMVKLEHGPYTIPARMMAVSFGPVAVVGISGEPFTGVGLAMKEIEPYKMVMPVCLMNGTQGYYPMMDSYEEGGYEARSSYFKAGTAEFVVSEARKLLKETEEG